MNSTEPEGQIKGDVVVKDGDIKSEEDRTVFTRIRRRSKRQVSLNTCMIGTEISTKLFRSFLFASFALVNNCSKSILWLRIYIFHVEV